MHDNKITNAYAGIVTEQPPQSVTHTLSNNDLSGTYIAFSDGQTSTWSNATTVNVNTGAQASNKSGTFLYKLFGVTIISRIPALQIPGGRRRRQRYNHHRSR